jgi:hypothetical protein
MGSSKRADQGITLNTRGHYGVAFAGEGLGGLKGLFLVHLPVDRPPACIVVKGEPPDDRNRVLDDLHTRHQSAPRGGRQTGP